MQETSPTPDLWNRNTFRIIAITLLTAALVTLCIIGIRRLIPAANDIHAGISARTISLRDSLNYYDSTTFAKNYRWTFGDGGQAFSSHGVYRYNTPGNYIIKLTINEQFTDTFYVTVKDTLRGHTIADSIMRIEAPSTGMQFENLVFRAIGAGATQYRWKFGETNFIDSKESFVQYYYKEPGTYTVLLFTDNSEYPVRHQIQILPSFQPTKDTLSIDDLYKGYEDDFKIHLQEIANGNNYNTNYYYLLKKYLCNNEKTITKINGAKLNDFNSYCLGLQFDEGIIIQSVKLTPDEQLNCIKTVEVKQVKN